MSMMGTSSAGGIPGYEPLMVQSGLPYGGPENAAMVQSQYPAAGMSTFGGAAPAHGSMHAAEPSGMSKGHGETHGGHGGHEGGHDMIDKETGQAPRRCTDVQTCFCFLVYLIIALTLLGVAAQHGNRGRLTHGTDYYGRVCGVDAGVENMPFLFWCRKDAPSGAAVPADIDLDSPSCVPYCPNSNSPTVLIPCLRKAVSSFDEIPGGQFGNVKTMVVKTQESLVQTIPYPTTPRGGRYCIPHDAALAEKVLESPKALGPFSSNRLLNMVGTLGHLYWLLAAASILSVLLGYAFIFCIKHCPYTIAKVFLLPLGLLTLFFAVFFSLSIILIINKDLGFKTFYEPKNNLYALYDNQRASWISLGIGIFCWILTGGLFGMAWNFKSIGVTDLINSAFETFRAVPALMYVPLFEGLAKFLVFWVGLQGFATICSEGFLEKNRIHVNGAKFAGLSRQFIPATEDWRFYAMGLVWIGLFMWTMEVCTAMGQFVTSFCTFKYYFVKKEKGKKGAPPGNTVCQGLKYALIYHPGSILKGAIWIPWFRPSRILNWMSAEFAGTDAPEPATMGGKVIKFLTGCCMCNWCPCGPKALCEKLQVCTREQIEEESCPCKDAFDDVIIRANDFNEGVEKAHDLLEHSHKIVQYLYRDHSQTTINLIGVISISGIVSSAVYLIVINLDMYAEPISGLYVADPVLVTVLTWFLSAYIAFGFMTLWDHTADSLLYCYAWSRRWNRKTVDQYVPESLRYIVGFDDMDHDRYPYYGKAKNNMYLRYWLPMVGMEDPKKAKKGAQKKDMMPTSVMETHAPAGIGMGRRPASQADASWMSGFGTGFGPWGRQQEAVSGEYMPEVNEGAPFLGA